MYVLGTAFEHTARLFSLMAQVRVDVFRLTLEQNTYIPSEVGNELEPSYVIESRIRSDVNKIRDSIVDLTRLCAGCQPQASLEKALLSVDKVLSSADDLTRAHREGFTLRGIVVDMAGKGPVNRTRDTLALSVRAMRTRIQEALDELAEYVKDSLPISLSEQLEAQIHYDQVRQSPQGAIQLAFAVVEDQLRNKVGVGPEVYGEDLINKAFGKEGSLIHSRIPAEQLGARNLFSGAYATLRNPRMHRFLKDDETTALAVVALTNLLAQITDKAESRHT